ncbi:ADP-ribosylglycohydrolase [Streptomyces lincolnensis]|uniref:ADP-ribosylglycohydrolase n=1 Tax=Streptomyces lincolnensis TaxID=1915 RepID=A0A1B1MBC2_STRLN|nr:ADP-ribosylglycohydrolase family protein [Streptomyces lincolnensis]ANS65918.1 ADP-ribosylglycohydrolase [Streptomyces lincolnensis]AXG54319.1 ADP-ribosylglycohydrolase [Streptomyces lincolnensis]QMV08695.1 ADP-ribosylglycohydrolase family protein [Streptomyces lincolnensis]
MGATAGAVWGRAEQQDFRSRVRGTLLGVAVGDALGSPVDGLGLAEIREEYGAEGLLDLGRGYGRRGAVSHLTQLTLFSVDGLIRAQVRRDTGAWHPPTDLHRAYRRWAATQRDWGPDERRKDDGWLAREEWLYARRDPTRALLLGLGDDTMGTLDVPKNPGETGPEAAARSAPFGLLVGWEPQLVVQLAVECAAQTHGGPVGYLSAGAYAVIVHALACGESLDGAVQRALALLAPRPGHEPVSEGLQHALGAVRQGIPTPARVEELIGDGTAAGLVSAAVYCALVGEDVRQGLCLAVNHDGPSAATAALTGGLLGALHGETALPPAWLAELEGRPTLLELADDFAMEMTQGPALHGPAGASPGWLARYPRA